MFNIYLYWNILRIVFVFFLSWPRVKKVSCLMTKPTKWHVRPAKTQISLGIRPVWSESSLSAWRKLGSLATHWAHSEDSDQIGLMPRLIWVFTGLTCHFVGFVMRRLKWIWLDLTWRDLKSERQQSLFRWEVSTFIESSFCEKLW